jgi:RimJ/RimL family protein N-acetyltransferase
MHIRRLTTRDTAALLRFYESLSEEVHWFYRPFGEITAEVMRGHLAGSDALEDITKGVFDESCTIVGHAFILGIQGEAPTFGIGLHQSVHGRGLGRELMVRVLEEADGLGLPRVDLTVIKANERAVRLYESLGFALTGECTFRSENDSHCMSRLRPVGDAMTFRRRLYSVLFGRRPDVMPWFSDLSYWYGSQGEALPEEHRGAEGFVQLHRDYGVGYYLGYATVWTAGYDGVEVSAEAVGPVRRTTWRTPVGEIFAEERYLPETYSSAWTRWAVQTPDDLRVLRYIAEATRIEPDHEGFLAHKRLAGAQGLPTILPPRSPLSQALAQWTGAEHLAYLVADAPEEVERTFAALSRAADPAYEAICEADTVYVEMGDNLTGEVVTRLFERYQCEEYLRRVEQLHTAGIKFGTHLDGTMRGILPLLARTGLDVVESITPAPVGDADIAEARAMAGPELILWGGVPGAMFAPPFTEADVRRLVEEVIAQEWPANRFILGSADQVPPNGDLERVRLVSRCCQELCHRT